MPVIINPKNMAEYKREKAEQNQKKPAFTTVKWGKAAAKEGEEVELTAQAKDIEDGDLAAFQVGTEGQDPASHTSYHRIPANIEGGMARGKWAYHPVDAGEEVPPAENPKFFFTVHSAWRRHKESGKLTVELKRPEMSNPEWQDGEGKSAEKGLVGEALKLSVICNEDMEEGTGVTFRVYQEGADPKRDRAAAELASSNRGGKAEAEWKPVETREAGDTAELKYFFIAITQRAKEVKSSPITVKNPRIAEMKWEPDLIYQRDEVKLRIKTFETAEFNPKVKIALWEQEEEKPEICIKEYEVVIDKDEVELDIQTVFAEEELHAYRHQHKYAVHAALTCETLNIKNTNKNMLQIETEDLYD
jgi:hypothetical protein